MKFDRLPVFFLILFLLGIIAYFQHEPTAQASQSTIQEYPKETAILLRVIDGDTIEIDDGPHVRLLGINTPEKKMPFSNESKKFLSQFINQTIFLQRDKEDTDKYNRKLRYLFYNNSLVNKQILENGFANTYYLAGLKYEKELITAESQAKTNHLGIWTPSNEICSKCIYLRELNFQEEFFTIGNNCSFSCPLAKWFAKDAGRNTFYLSSLDSQEEKIYKSKNNTEVWNNEGDRFFMFDKNGYLVMFYQY